MSRPLPILLIHGFNGDPGDWTDSGFLQYLLAEGDLDPELVRLFRYGVAEDGTYNNRGDVRQIASRLAGVGLAGEELVVCSVDRLSQDSQARGGPAQVTLIAHSMGGIISRYYLSCSQPDEFGTVYRGNVGRLIQIASPNQGVDLLRLTKLAPRHSPTWHLIRFLEKLGFAPALPATKVEEWEAAFDRMQTEQRSALAPELFVGEGGSAEPTSARVLLTDTPVYQQLAPNSPLLTALNQPGTIPEHVECHTFYGDIRVRVRVLLGEGSIPLLDHTVSFGDLVVPAYSAMEIPGARAVPHPWVSEYTLNLTLRKAAEERRSIASLLPENSHARLLSHRGVQEDVLGLLT